MSPRGKANGDRQLPANRSLSASRHAAVGNQSNPYEAIPDSGPWTLDAASGALHSLVSRPLCVGLSRPLVVGLSMPLEVGFNMPDVVVLSSSLDCVPARPSGRPMPAGRNRPACGDATRQRKGGSGNEWTC